MTDDQIEFEDQLNSARDLFQVADVNFQYEIEALRAELRSRGIFAEQARPTSFAYESIFAVMLMQISTGKGCLKLSRAMLSNPHRYNVPTAMPRDLMLCVKADLLLVDGGIYSPALRLLKLLREVRTAVNGEDAA